MTIVDGVTIMEPEIKDVLNRKQRQKNANDILNRLDPDKHNFNVIILGFADIIQSSFYKFVESQCRSQSELRKKQDRMNKTISDVLTLLNESGLDNAEDMVVLSTCMVEAINRALVRQQENGVSIRPGLKEKGE